MSKHEDSSYFTEARSWALDNVEGERRARRTAWIVAGVASVVALFEALALFALMPLKTTETVTLLVDRTTGFVQRIDPSEAAPIRANEVLLQSLLAQYVVAREGFDRATVKADYRKAALWSAGTARNTYIADMAVANPASPFNRYRPGDSLAVTVKSVTQAEPGNALVRFDTRLVGRDGRESLAGSWIALVKYSFSDAPMSYEDRLLNPLGLQVQSYRRDTERPQEQIAPATVVVPAAPRGGPPVDVFEQEGEGE